MNAVTYAKKQIELARELADTALQGADDGQVNAVAPGTTNPVGLVALHLADAEDQFIAAITGQPSVWKSQGWADKIGLQRMPRRGQDWTPLKDTPLSLEVLQGYLAAVRTTADAYLETLTDEELDREVDFFGGKSAVADVLVLMAAHTLHHGGEIAALRGALGARGLPF